MQTVDDNFTEVFGYPELDEEWTGDTQFTLKPSAQRSETLAERPRENRVAPLRSAEQAVGTPHAGDWTRFNVTNSLRALRSPNKAVQRRELRFGSATRVCGVASALSQLLFLLDHG